MDNAFEAAGRPVSVLARRELLVASAEPHATLATSLGAASRVVRAEVTDLTFTPSGTVASLRVLDTFKGVPGHVDIRLAGGPEPDAEFGEGYLGIDPAVPFLLEGTAAFLLLDADADGTVHVQPFADVLHATAS